MSIIVEAFGDVNAGWTVNIDDEGQTRQYHPDGKDTWGALAAAVASYSEDRVAAAPASDPEPVEQTERSDSGDAPAADVPPAV